MLYVIVFEDKITSYSYYLLDLYIEVIPITKKNISKNLVLHCNTLDICTRKEEILSIRIDVELKKKLQAKADKESRTLSDFVLNLKN